MSTISVSRAVENLQENVLICGHTHRPWSIMVGDILVVNPGSVGNPCNGDPMSDYAVLTWVDDRWDVEHRSVEYDYEAACRNFIDSGIIESVGSIAKAYLMSRMTGIDVTLDFLDYLKDIQQTESLTYEEAFSAAGRSFDWTEYVNLVKFFCDDFNWTK